ncbi:hypothetical protein LCGC14_3012220, partial [marine sediment metagenome]
MTGSDAPKKVGKTPKRFIISVFGHQKTCMTRFALTAPGPVLFFNTDISTVGAVGKSQKGLGG